MPTIREILTDKVNGGTFISLDTETVVTLTGGKKNPLQGRVSKRVVGSNVMIFQNKNSNAYKNMVERRLEREGKNPNDFQLSPRTWGVREVGTPFVSHKGNEYLEVIFLKAGQVQYLVDRKVVPKDQIVGLPVVQEAEQGGLDNKVIIRTYAVENIRAITVDQDTFIL